MNRRGPTVAGLAIGMLAGMMLLGYLRPGHRGPAATGPMIAECGGPIKSVVMQYTSGADFVWPVYRAFLGQQPRGVTVYLACPERADFEELVAALGAVPCRIVPIFTHHAMTAWSRDRWVAFLPATTGGRVTLLAQAGEVQEDIWPQRAGDGKVAEDLAKALPVTARRSNLYFDGGDLLADGACVFATRAVLERNLQRRASTREQLLAALEQELGQHVTLLAEGPDHHAGMFMMAAGERRMLVADPSLGRSLFDPDAPVAAGLAGGADFSAETQRRFDSVAAAAEACGYRVTRVSVVPAHDGKMYLTYVNVIMDEIGGRRVVYMPVFAGQDRLNAAGTAVWESLGYQVRPIDCTSVWQRGGSLHCLVNVLERAPQERPLSSAR